jgi:hypothetical protein
MAKPIPLAPPVMITDFRVAEGARPSKIPFIPLVAIFGQVGGAVILFRFDVLEDYG